jgi:CubicO group peptidase (beta-lactamase class C family)
MIREAKPNQTISSLLKDRIDAGDFPSAVYLVAERGEIIFAEALGDAVHEPRRIPATLDTIYDLASLTKPLVTGLLCARRLESGKLTLDHPVARYLPEFDRPDKQMITVRQLLTHTSGLPAWHPLYVDSGGNREKTLSATAGQQLEYAAGTRVVYSDLGFITLGFLLERLTEVPFAELARREVIESLRLDRTSFNPEHALQTAIAASEAGNAYERETCGQPGLQFKSWREDLIWGEVHDANAHFLGGAAGHAGLFSTVKETLRLAHQFLPEQSQLLQPETCNLFRTNMTVGLNEDRSVGWQLASTRDSTAGPELPSDSFGHTGFTGTSCWTSPDQQRIFILFTNRTHARALPFANINSVRRQFHSLAAAALDELKIMDQSGG